MSEKTKVAAAAPDLLKAAEYALFALSTVEVTVQTAAAKHRLRKAIAKAKGEPDAAS